MSFLNMVARGNIQRVKEFHQLGLRPSVIVGKFAHRGVHISEDFVNCIINGEFDEIDRVAIKRSDVESLRRDINEISSGLLPA